MEASLIVLFDDPWISSLCLHLELHRPPLPFIAPRKGQREVVYVLADQQDIDSSQIEVVEVRHGCHTLPASMHTSVELREILAATE